MTEVIMPKMGDGMEEGTLLEWLKKDGETVRSGEVIGTIQTDKATLELEAPGSGRLAGILIAPGETVPVGKPIALLLKDGESVPSEWGGAAASSPAATAVVEAPKVETAVAAIAAPATTNGSDRIKASPLARRIAADRGIDLAGVTGTGPGGRIVERDLESVVAAKPKVAVAPALVASAEDQVVKVNRIRQITAQRTQHSKQTVPHFYVTVEVDLEAIQALRDQFAAEESGKVSVNDFIVKSVALALRDMPQVNASYQEDGSLLIYGGVNIGMAVALEDGLTVPVIKNADALTLRQIGARARELAGLARENRLPLDDLSGSTFSISNMGMLDVENFAAIINEPNSGIIAVGTARRTLVVNDEDEVEVRLRMKMTGSFDHRVVDGAVGANFMNAVRGYLENPTRLLS
ncbi:MAG: 2-oxo acid dehydrogenase subunit E2 [Methanoregulaceae archaeon]|nr:2-oxo acid dehydrogenase subunit E2 [Methanoregulaceae archaeon]